MPFDKTPSISTYQTKQVSLIADMNSRNDVPTTDVDYLNCFVEITKSKAAKKEDAWLRKRSGTSVVATLPSSNVRKIYYWEDQQKLYFAHGHDVSVYLMPNFAFITTLVNVFPTTTTGDVGMVEFLYDTGDVKLVVSDGVTLSTIDSAQVVVAGADPDMPVHIPSIVFLDGYLFMVKAESADLYNSNLNDPLAYTAGDFISSEILADRATYVAKLNNYILLFGNESIEYFWDAANETGSPLQRNDTPVKFTGLIGGICQYASNIYFVGDKDESQANVFVLEDFKITPVGDENIRRWLSSTAPGLYGNILSIDGHDFYCLYAGGQYTYMMELDTRLWSRLGYQSSDVFPITYAFNARVGVSYFPIFAQAGTAAISKFSPTLYQDNGVAITTKAVLNNEEFETYNQKNMARLTLWADRSSGSNPVTVQWSDDDYQTYNTGQTLELNQEMPCIYRLGRFRRRAFKITHTANKPLRIKTAEVDINMGQS